MSPSILVVLTSHADLADTGKKTGWYLSEFSHPHHVFASSSPPPKITVASPRGGAAPLDQSSIEAAKDDEISVEFLHKQSALWEATTPLSQILQQGIDSYDALFFPGGHGPMFDLAGDKESQEIVKRFWEAGKIVSAVCHGPAALVNVKLSNGYYLLKGKKVTAFSNSEEDGVGLSEKMPFMLETRIKEVGAEYEKAGQDWGEKLVVDGKLITGQNPASAKAVGEAILKVI
ncbi:hypothetical protein QC762_600120 [Podospora pseudocomata]|uniref:D-lactate dehydratase n=1 Tax=Podospora pseudocomata TaxID=2093779 RepID=A0ABR0G8B2_9PEZI|nr:hypothetical protein QC762_600120 [Podospora pseudocomata]